MSIIHIGKTKTTLYLGNFGVYDKLAKVSGLKMAVRFESEKKAFDAAIGALRNIFAKIKFYKVIIGKDFKI